MLHRCQPAAAKTFCVASNLAHEADSQPTKTGVTANSTPAVCTEALIATAIGLVAAIPAVVAYNWALSRMRILEADMENFGNDFLNIVKRHFFK